MNRAEVVVLIAECRAMYPQMSMVPGMDDAWLQQLGRYELDEARLALTRWGGEQDGIPSLAAIRRFVRDDRQREAMYRSGREAIEHRNGRQPMPSWFRSVMEESREEARGHYADLAERNRQAEKAQTGVDPGVPEPLRAGDHMGVPHRRTYDPEIQDPQSRQAGRD